MELERYIRQTIFSRMGEEGQRKLLASSVVIIGCGGLGCNIATLLTRAGVGHIRVVDRDYVELDNLHRQVLFDEEDVERGLPKAIAAAEKLRKVNSQVEIEPLVADVHYRNVEEIIVDMDLVLDGTDNFETRYLINDACVKHGTPWIYGGAVGSYGMTMNIIPHQTPCLRCLFVQIPPPGTTPTCDTVGVLGAVPALIGAIEANEALKLLAGKGRLNEGLIHIDLWENTFEIFQAARQDSCPACGQGKFEFLEAKEVAMVTSLCGRNAVQITPVTEVTVSLPALAKRLEAIGEVTFNEFMLRFQVNEYLVTIFPDARAIIRGTSDETVARNLYAKYIGT
jgi:molybdopterin/thiamine biosynthesis adenylyltransferase